LLGEQRKTTIVAKSTMAAEYIAASMAAEQILSIRNILHELGFTQETPTPLFEDNAAMRKVAQDELLPSKHVELHAHWLQNQVALNRIQIVACRSKDQIADIFTKALPRVQFCELRSKLSLIPIS
jgi:hypothetical protein